MTPQQQPASQRGQLIVLFALCLVAVIAMAGLLIDGGRAWQTRRQTQAAADTAALAAAYDVVKNGGTDVTYDGHAAATLIATTNGISTAYTNCSSANKTDGVVVNRPPSAQSSHADDKNYVEVITNRPMSTTFAGIVGQTCWMVSARATASIGSASVASCSFCSLDNSKDNHTLLLKNSASLRVDGDIYVNSSSGGISDPCALDDYKVCGDGFDVFSDKDFTGTSYISAKTISTVGGWETHDKNLATADDYAQVGSPLANCPEHPDPLLMPGTKVCIHMPELTDPLNDPTKPDLQINPPPIPPKPAVGGDCPPGALIPTGTATTRVLMTVAAATTGTICPGAYYGGLKILGNVTMIPGIYYIAGGGFEVSGAGAVNGSAGVMIFNAMSAGSATNTTSGGVDFEPAPSPTATCDPKLAPGLASNHATAQTTDQVTYTMTIDKTNNTAPCNVAPTGSFAFYDGPTLIAGCSNVTGTVSGTKLIATCGPFTYPFGWRSITAVYLGNALFKPTSDNLTEKITPPAGTTAAGDVDIETSGSVTLWAPSSGMYSGLTIYQDRGLGTQIILSPGPGSAPDCPGNFMTAPLPAKPACGSIGGLQGTIYAAAAPGHSGTGSGPTTQITASGLAVLQIISDNILVTNTANARFAYDGNKFANGGIRLVE
jgi:Flp pilus assembly protein TadG